MPALPPVRFIDDPELAYVVTRARQVHDFWHVLFGCHTNVFGEVALKAVEFVQVGVGALKGGQPLPIPAERGPHPFAHRGALLPLCPQTGMPMTALAVLAGEWRLAPADRDLLNSQFLPWALRAGARAPDLMCIYYERHFEEPLEELRLRWRIETAPSAPQNMQRHRPAGTAPTTDTASTAGSSSQPQQAPDKLT
jgi:ubiquinone biosynthesis protein COQ4